MLHKDVRGPFGRLLSVALFSVSLLYVPSAALAEGGGLAMHGEAKYQPGFKHFDYVNPNAPQGGTITLGWPGNFDSLNPFSVKSLPAALLQSLVFQDLGAQSHDEAFSMYPALAESFEVAADNLSLTVTLRKDATFSDGKPVTADDVVFSFNLFLSDHVLPFYKAYYADFKGIEKLGPHQVKLTFKQVNPELPLIATQLTVLPKHIYEKGDFGKLYNDTAIGSGPYVVDTYKRGQYVEYKKNPKFWGTDKGIYKGLYNFDRIVIKYYKDDNAMKQGFLKGDFDFYPVYSSKTWAVDMAGEKFDKLKWISRETWHHFNNEGSQGFLFNLRQPMFQDVRVRQAIALAFDFDWSNKNLFYDQYKENTSFFENSPLKAEGLPNEEEKKILSGLPDLPPDVLAKPMGHLSQEKDIKKRLRMAKQLLTEAGYNIKDNVATGPGGPLKIELLLRQDGFQRVIEPWAQNLRKLGVIVEMVLKEQSEYVRRVENFEFEMIVFSRAQSQSPGNEQKNYWTSEAADQKYSQNLGGVKNKAVDALVEKIIYAKTRQELELYTRCLDRVLYHIHLVVHNWHNDGHRVAFWNRFGRPVELPKFYSAYTLLETMWIDKQMDENLKKAMAAKKPLY